LAGFLVGLLVGVFEPPICKNMIVKLDPMFPGGETKTYLKPHKTTTQRKKQPQGIPASIMAQWIAGDLSLK